MNTRLQFLLEAEGLEHLLAVFLDQGVTDSILGDLTDSDLRELGIGKLGERKRLLAAFESKTGSPVAVSGTIEMEQNVRELISMESSPVIPTLDSGMAKDSIPESTPQEQFTYDAKNGEIIITGFRGKGHVVVPSRFDDLPLPVRVIGRDAFRGNSMILSMVLPQGIRHIESGSPADTGYDESTVGGAAFSLCTSLTSITIPDSVVQIGEYLFFGCTSLTSIMIPDSVTQISDNAFTDCTSLTSITIPDSVTQIGGGAFSRCTSLTSITIPDSVTSINCFVFSDCTGLTSITIPNSVTWIGELAFSDCTSLTSITIPSSVTKIGDSAFKGCTSLMSITIPDSVTSIGRCAFYRCTSLTSITIPDGVTQIGALAFRYCSSELEIEIPPHLVTRFEGTRFKISVRNDTKSVFITKASTDEEIPASMDPPKELFATLDYLIFVGAALLLIAIVVIFVVYARTN